MVISCTCLLTLCISVYQAARVDGVIDSQYCIAAGITVNHG